MASAFTYGAFSCSPIPPPLALYKLLAKIFTSCPSWPGTHSVAQADFEFLFLLPGLLR